MKNKSYSGDPLSTDDLPRYLGNSEAADDLSPTFALSWTTSLLLLAVPPKLSACAQSTGAKNVNQSFLHRADQQL